MKFNINNNVKVRLTQSGLDALRKNHEKVFAGVTDMYPYVEPRVDAEGWTSFQMWELMYELGPYIVMGMPVPFATEIDIQE